MTNTSNYNLLLAEGTDLVNYLTQTNPNFTSLDTIIKGVSDATVTTATEVTTGTAHAISRTLPDANVIRFTATSNWVTGDTMTVDGVSVTPLKTDGTSLKSGDYLIGSAVIMVIDSTRCTVFVSSSPEAADIRYDNTGSGLTSTDVQDAIDEINNNLIDQHDGATFTLTVFGQTISTGNDANFYVNLPFVAKNTNYDVNVTSMYLFGVGNVTPNNVSKQATQIGLTYNLTGETAGNTRYASATLTITFH